MRAVHTHKASAGQSGADFLAWAKAFGRDLLGRRPVTTHEAAQALSRAAAEARARKNLTIAEKREALHAQLRAAREAGFIGGVKVR